MIERLQALPELTTTVFEIIYNLAKENDEYYLHIGNDLEEGESGIEPFSFEIQESFMVEDMRAKVIVAEQNWICNGDLMCDPCMRFMYIPEIHKVYPMDYQMDGVLPYGTMYQVCMEIGNNEIARLNLKLEKELAEFADTWIHNLYFNFHEIYALNPELKTEMQKYEE